MFFSIGSAVLTAAMVAQQPPPKKPRPPRPVVKKRTEQPEQADTRTGYELCVDGKVVWADGTTSDCKQVR